MVFLPAGRLIEQHNISTASSCQPSQRASGGDMAGALWVLAALCAILEVRSSPLPPTLLGPKRSLIPEAIAHYNKESNSEFLFMLLSEQTESEGTNEARFTIKETVCRKPDAGQRMGCAYRAGGLEKNCSAEMKENRFTVVCSSLETSKGGEGSNPSGGGRDTYSRERTVIITQNYPSASPVSDHTERKISHREFDQHHDNDHEDNRKDDQHDEGDHTDDHEDDHEDDQHDEGDHMDDHEDDYENDQHDEDALADIVIQFSNDPPRAGGPVRPQGEKRKPLSGVYLGRILCLECIFNEFPRK